MIYNLYDIDEEQWKKNFAAKFNTLLGAKNVSINKAANEIGVDGKTLRSYSSGTSVPSAIIICKLAKYFDVSTDYFITNTANNTGFSDNTIIELANIVKLFNVKVIVSDNEDVVTIHINNKIITSIVAELYYSRNRSDYDSVAATLANAYGRLKVHNSNLVDYTTFENLIRHKFIYHGFEDDCFDCIDENGNDCIAVDDWEAIDEIYRREEEWYEMSVTEREKWWKEFCKSQ